MTGFARNVDQRSSGLHGTAHVRNLSTAWGIHTESDQNLGNQWNSTMENSIDSQRSEIDYDRKTQNQSVKK